MRRRSKNNSGNKNNMPSKAKKSKPSEAEDVTQAPSEASRPESPMEVYISDYELPSEAPSTSQDTSNKAVELIETEQLAKIHEKVNLILDKCFLNQSEMVVNRRVLEDIVSDTLGLCYSEEDKNMIEVRNLAEKCKTLQAEQIKLNRQRFALRKQVEDAKHIIKKLIDEKHLYNRGIIRRILPTKRKVRTVGLQVCMVGPMFVSKPVVSYSTAITNRYTESTMPPVEPQTARKRTFNKEIDVRKNNEPSTSKVNPNQSANIRTPSKKGNSSGIISNITTRRMSQESSNSKALPIKENPIPRELNTNEESAYSGALKKGSNFDSNSKRTPVRKSKLEEPELEYIKPTSSVKTRSMGGLKKNDIKNVNQVGKLSKAFNKGSENGVLIHEEGKSEVIIKEEVVDDIVEISEDEEMEETISEMKEVVNISDKKEAAIQVGVNKYSHGNSFAKSNEASSSRAKSNEASSSHAKYNEASSSHTKSNTASSSHAKSNEASSSHAKSNEASSSHAKSNEASSSQCAGPLIKVRSPEFINEQFIKSLNSSGSTSGVEKNVSFCQLPKYPISPKYPPYVSKPPAPILQIGKKSNIETQGIMLTWNFANKKPENIVEYQLFAYQEKSGRNPNDAWKKVGDIKALPLPMACYLSQFVENETYHFIIRAVDNHKRVGDFSIPAGIKLQKLDPSLKTPSGTLFKVPSPQN